MNKSSLMLYGCAAVLLAACGGGGGSTDAAPPAGAADSVPAEASESAAKMAAWLTLISGESADAREPLNTGSFDPKRAENTDPEKVSP